ncbi:hypothetical protein KIPB_008307, partial [Kipferlia bialata]
GAVTIPCLAVIAASLRMWYKSVQDCVQQAIDEGTEAKSRNHPSFSLPRMTRALNVMSPAELLSPLVASWSTSECQDLEAQCARAFELETVSPCTCQVSRPDRAGSSPMDEDLVVTHAQGSSVAGDMTHLLLALTEELTGSVALPFTMASVTSLARDIGLTFPPNTPFDESRGDLEGFLNNAARLTSQEKDLMRTLVPHLRRPCRTLADTVLLLQVHMYRANSLSHLLWRVAQLQKRLSDLASLALSRERSYTDPDSDMVGDASVFIAEMFDRIVARSQALRRKVIEAGVKKAVFVDLLPVWRRVYYPTLSDCSLEFITSCIRGLIHSGSEVCMSVADAYCTVLLDSGPRSRSFEPPSISLITDDYQKMWALFAGDPQAVSVFEDSSEAEVGLSLDTLQGHFQQLTEIVRYHSELNHAVLMQTASRGTNRTLAELDRFKGVRGVTSPEIVIRVLNFRRYSVPSVRQWLHVIRKKTRR